MAKVNRYTALALICKEHYKVTPELSYRAYADFVYKLSAWCAENDKNFQPALFMSACHVS